MQKHVIAERTSIWIGQRLVAAMVAVAAIAVAYGPAAAQQVVALVNGDPITAIDIAQRTKLVQLSTHRVPSRQEVLDELIDEKLKLQVAKRYKLEITDSEVNSSFNSIATRAGSTAEKFGQALAGQGVSVDTVKNRIRADLGWSQIVRGKFNRSSTFANGTSSTRCNRRARTTRNRSATNTRCGRSCSIVPRGSSEEVIAGRRREAEGLRTRFQNCDEGIRLARGLRDVAVREPVIRTSGDLSAPMREILDGTQEGRLTAPETTAQGIELFALCSKRTTTSELPGKREAREKILQERFVEQSKRYLKELRSGAMIEYR